MHTILLAVKVQQLSEVKDLRMCILQISRERKTVRDKLTFTPKTEHKESMLARLQTFQDAIDKVNGTEESISLRHAGKEASICKKTKKEALSFE